jgi:copper chaperone CopZ
MLFARERFTNSSSNKPWCIIVAICDFGAKGRDEWETKTKGAEKNMNWRKQATLPALLALLFTAAAFGQAKSETAKPDRASVWLQFEKEGTVSTSCSQTLGVITQTMLQIEGVKNVKTDAKSNRLQVSYDPAKITPKKIVRAFNKENPDTLLQLADTKEIK